MKHVSILIPQGGAVMGSIEGPHKLFTTVNEFMAGMGRPPLFDVHLVGISKDAQVYEGVFSAHPDQSIAELENTDLIVIPALKGDLNHAIELNGAFIPWILDMHEKGSDVASLCIGAFLLAATGLMSGKSCTTHWNYAPEFRKMFPDVNLLPENVITDEQGIYTSGGAYSYLNLIVYLIEKYGGRDLAVVAAKVFGIEIDRDNQSQFMIFRGLKDHDDDLVKRAQEYIEANYTQRITVDELASMLALGRRNLERRFKRATSNTVVEYMQRVKIEAAKMSLESSRENVNEVMYSVGYTDTKAFRSTFKRITGLSPVQYRQKYNRDFSTFGRAARLSN